MINVGVFLHFLATNPLILLILILTIFVLYILVRLWRSLQGPLRYGRVVYADHSNWRPGKSLYSRTWNLAGKPDYVVNTGRDGIIPVEVKSTPWHGRVYDSHKMQLAAYCLLLEENGNNPPPYGVLQYGDGYQVKIPYTGALRSMLLQTMNEMRSLQLPQGWQPNPRRCRSCGMRTRCDRVVT